MTFEELKLGTGWQIRLLRLRLGLTQDELARRCSLKSSYMCNAEAGANFEMKTLHNIAEQLGVDYHELTRILPDWRQTIIPEVEALEKELWEKIKQERRAKKGKPKKRKRRLRD